MPKISIIVPVYNVEQYLQFCLESIFAQTFSDFELILIDDGSTDKSGQICDEYAKTDARVRVFHTENRGSAMARNLGLELVKSDYIAMIDSDDYVHPFYLQYLFELLQKYNADIVCRLDKAFVYNSEIELNAKADFMRDKVKVYNQKQILNLLCVHYSTSLICPMKLYRKSVFNNIRYPDVPKNDDEWVIHKLFLNSRTVVIAPAKLYYWRNRQFNQTNSFSAENISGLLALVDRYKALKKHGYVPPPDFYIRFMRLSIDYCSNCIKYDIDPVLQINLIKTPLKICYIKLFLNVIKRFVSGEKQIYDRNDFYRMFLFAFMQKKYFQKYG